MSENRRARLFSGMSDQEKRRSRLMEACTRDLLMATQRLSSQSRTYLMRAFWVIVNRRGEADGPLQNASRCGVHHKLLAILLAWQWMTDSSPAYVNHW